VRLTAIIYHHPAGFAIWTFYDAKTAIALQPKFNQRSLIHNDRNYLSVEAGLVPALWSCACPGQSKSVLTLLG